MASSVLTQTASIKRSASPYQLVHIVPGRIRLRVPKVAHNQTYACKLEQSLKALPFVTSVLVNPKAQSVTIQYKANQVNQNIKELIGRAFKQANAPEISPHSTSALARRLGVTLQALNGRRSRIDFADWSQARDPEAIAWRYDDASKAFHPVIYISDFTQAVNSQSSMFQTLSVTVGGKVGGMLGKVTGEVIGLMVLGSVGVILGAEVGALIGEVIGTELGNTF